MAVQGASKQRTATLSLICKPVRQPWCWQKNLLTFLPLKQLHTLDDPTRNIKHEPTVSCLSRSLLVDAHHRPTTLCTTSVIDKVNYNDVDDMDKMQTEI